MQKHTKVFLAVLAVLLAARLAVMSVAPVFDPSESRYAAISANMARTGDFTVPRFTHDGEYQPFRGKPPLLFQLGGAACRVFGTNEFAVRLPSFLAFGALLALVFSTAGALGGRDRALAATAVTASAVSLYALAGFCMTDMLLTLAVAGAVLLYARFDHDRARPAGYGVFALLGVGMLVKGPVALVLFGLPVFAWTLVNRRWETVRRLPWPGGVLLFLVVCVPWYARMASLDDGFLRYFFVNENLLRFLVHDYGDKYGAGRETFRGMAAVWMLVTALPWTLPALPALCGRDRVRTNPFVGPGSLFVTGCAAITAFWCLTSRVPLTYVAPAVPLFAVALALRVEPARLLRLFPAAAVICVVALCGTFLYTGACTDKLPGGLFRRVDRALPDAARVAFVGAQPYSAEFNLHDHLAPVISPEQNVLVRTRKLHKFGLSCRPVLMQANGWSLLGPEKGARN